MNDREAGVGMPMPIPAIFKSGTGNIMFCFHKWVEVTRVLTPGVYLKLREFGMYNPFEKVVEAAQDHTSIELKCSKCGYVTNRTLIGDFTKK